MNAYSILEGMINKEPEAEVDQLDFLFDVPEGISNYQMLIDLVCQDHDAIQAVVNALEDENNNFSDLEKTSMVFALEATVNMKALFGEDVISEDNDGNVSISTENLKEKLTAAKNTAVNFIKKMVDKLQDFYRKFQTSQTMLLKFAKDVRAKNFKIIEGKAPKECFMAPGKQITDSFVKTLVDEIHAVSKTDTANGFVMEFYGLGGTKYDIELKHDKNGIPEDPKLVAISDDKVTAGNFSLKGESDIAKLVDNLGQLVGVINKIDHKKITKHIYDRLDEAKESKLLTELSKGFAQEIRFLTVTMPVKEAKAAKAVLKFIGANGK